MKTYALTGGIGMGKSTAANLLRHWGVPLTDSDEIARQIIEPGQPALAEIQAAFGPEIVGADGCLRRAELARMVFADAPARRQLEAIMHPRIRAVWQAQIASWRAQDKSLVAAVIPLLFETDAAKNFDATVCVACSAATQRRRLLERGWTLDQIEQRLQAQWPIEEKIVLADYVVWTEGGLELLAEQLQRIFGFS
jgi:dephospho-CoA kinase